MLELPGGRRIPRAAVRFSSLASRGPGGQNVNKRATRIRASVSIERLGLPGDVARRLRRLAGSQVSHRGNVVISSDRFRSNARNRQDCLARLASLLDQAWTRPKRRKKTRPTKGSKERRLAEKRRRGEIKSRRRTPPPDGG